jgi:hypothetical protein
METLRKDEELRALFEAYAAFYDRFDPGRISEFMNCPLVIVREGEPIVHDTPEKIRGFLSKLLEWFRDIRHGKSSISGFEVRPLGRASAFVNVVWRSTRVDGATYTEWPTAYHVIRDAERWRILVIVLRYEAPRETPCA